MPGGAEAVAPSSKTAQRIKQKWLAKLASAWGHAQRVKLERFERVIEGRADAFSYLEALADEAAADERERIVTETVDRIQSEQFDIADLFEEIRQLDRTVTELREERPGATTVFDDEGPGSVRARLDSFFETIVKETSLIYEFFSERGAQSLCVLDADGRITFANSSARRLLQTTRPRGKRFGDFLSAADRAQVDEIVATLAEGAPRKTTLQFTAENGRVQLLHAEIARMHPPTPRSTFYVSLSPMPKVLGVEDEALESFEQGILRIDADRNILYANAALLRLLGYDKLSHGSVDDLLADDDARQTVEDELDSRKQGRLGKYRVWLKQKSGRRTLVSVTALPERDTDGQLLGSTAIITSLEREQARRELAECLHEQNREPGPGTHTDSHEQTWQTVLAKLCSVLMRYVNADVIVVFRWTPDEKHSSAVISFTRDGGWYQIDRRWFPLEPALRDWMRSEVDQPYYNLDEFLESEKGSYLKNEPSVRKMRDDHGIQSFMRLPLMKDGSNLAGLSFLSFEPQGFSQEEWDLVDDLPIASVVLSAIERKDREERAFQFRLMAALSECRSFEEMSSKVTSALAEHYGWAHVSVFQVVEERGLNVLQTQAHADPAHSYPAGHSFPIGRGLLGRAVREETLQYAPHPTKRGEGGPDGGSDRPDQAARALEGTQSQLVIPIRTKLYDPARVFWLLNIEDPHEALLIEQEIDDLRLIASHVEFFVNRLIDRYTYENAMQRTSDGIIITDANGRIRHVNDAAAEILGCTEPERLLHTDISVLFADLDDGERFLEKDVNDSYRVALNGAGGRSVPVLMSQIQMPKEVSDRYFIFKDMRAEDRLSHLEDVETVIGDLALLTKTPLSIVQGMLRQLYRMTDGDGSAEQRALIARLRRQLERVEFAYDRAAYVESIKVLDPERVRLLRLARLFDAMGEDLSDEDGTIFDLQIPKRFPAVLADPYQLSFVLESLVSYLLRTLPVDGRIEVAAREDGDVARISLSAPCAASRKMRQDDGVDDLSHVRKNIVLGRRLVDRFVADNDGSIEGPITTSGRAAFELTLPVAQGGGD